MSTAGGSTGGGGPIGGGSSVGSTRGMRMSVAGADDDTASLAPSDDGSDYTAATGTPRPQQPATPAAGSSSVAKMKAAEEKPIKFPDIEYISPDDGPLVRMLKVLSRFGFGAAWLENATNAVIGLPLGAYYTGRFFVAQGFAIVTKDQVLKNRYQDRAGKFLAEALKNDGTFLLQPRNNILTKVFCGLTGMNRIAGVTVDSALAQKRDEYCDRNFEHDYFSFQHVKARQRANDVDVNQSPQVQAQTIAAQRQLLLDRLSRISTVPTSDSLPDLRSASDRLLDALRLQRDLLQANSQHVDLLYGKVVEADTPPPADPTAALAHIDRLTNAREAYLAELGMQAEHCVSLAQRIMQFVEINQKLIDGGGFVDRLGDKALTNAKAMVARAREQAAVAFEAEADYRARIVAVYDEINQPENDQDRDNNDAARDQAQENAARVRRGEPPIAETVQMGRELLCTTGFAQSLADPNTNRDRLTVAQIDMTDAHTATGQRIALHAAMVAPTSRFGGGEAAKLKNELKQLERELLQNGIDAVECTKILILYMQDRTAAVKLGACAPGEDFLAGWKVGNHNLINPVNRAAYDALPIHPEFGAALIHVPEYGGALPTAAAELQQLQGLQRQMRVEQARIAAAGGGAAVSPKDMRAQLQQYAAGLIAGVGGRIVRGRVAPPLPPAPPVPPPRALATGITDSSLTAATGRGRSASIASAAEFTAATAGHAGLRRSRSATDLLVGSRGASAPPSTNSTMHLWRAASSSGRGAAVFPAMAAAPPTAGGDGPGLTTSIFGSVMRTGGSLEV